NQHITGRVTNYRRTGRPNANIFETGQGRLTSLFWETPGPYLENSPVFHAHRATTPLLMVFGTDDDVVDFSQGVELYNVMRRSRRSVVMLAYEGEGHSFRDQDNREDATRRKLQWLDHHLKGGEGQPWMNGANHFMPATMQRAAAYVDSTGSDTDMP
ncbi:S9 family peptidase, partial [Ectothiorhodospira sp. 9905]|uniref:alpha/beta hydrolase family protein n=1 Tax=Ectothiorhodospira sp. 9905 TaxID=2897387 RepID=UPI001EE90FA5